MSFSLEAEQMDVLTPISGGGWAFDLHEEMEDLRDQVAFLRVQLADSRDAAELGRLRARVAFLEKERPELPPPAQPDRAAALRMLLQRCTGQRDEALELARAMAARLHRKGFKRAGRHLLEEVAQLRESWARPAPLWPTPQSREDVA